MARRTIQQRAELFGFDTDKPWALPALRLLFHVPRAYQPIVDAWDRRHPGVHRALDRLEAKGFVEHQPPVIIDTRTKQPADTETRRVTRYITTAAGTRLVRAISEDPRALEDRFQRVTPENEANVSRLLTALHLDKSHARFGMSGNHAIALSGLTERTGRYWIKHLQNQGLIRELDRKYADVRELIPAHWRVTKALARQLDDVLGSLPTDSPYTPLRSEFRLGRSRYLPDISVDRVGITGSTDFDHDVEAQRVLASLLGSPGCATTGLFSIEPRLHLPTDMSVRPWVFTDDGVDVVPHQPDAIITELEEIDGRLVPRRNLIEYERHQTRRDAWSHIERFLGYLHTRTLPTVPATLRFVVDTEAREKTYVELIEAFTDYSLDYPERMPVNPAILAVSSKKRLAAAPDPLGQKAWFRIHLPQPDDADIPRSPVLHDKNDSPYDEYFARHNR